MKKVSKCISLLLAALMVFSVLPLTASAAAINTTNVNTVEKLIQNDSVANLAGYLVEKINATKDTTLPTALRFVFLLMDNEDINKSIGTKEVTALTGAQSSKILLDWLDANAAFIKEGTEI